MSLFAIADTHLSFSADKSMEVFPGWGNYTQRLADHWRESVCETDTVVIAGDISWAMKLPEALRDFQFLHEMPGQKIILKGNHDYWWESKKKMDDFLAENGLHTIKILFNNAFRVGNIAVCGTRGWFYDDLQAEDPKVLLREAGRLRLSIAEAKKMGGEPVVFLHYPPLNETRICRELVSVLEEEGILRCFYGHLHEKSTHRALQGFVRGVRYQLISGDYLGFRPIKVEEAVCIV